MFQPEECIYYLGRQHIYLYLSRLLFPFLLITGSGLGLHYLDIREPLSAGFISLLVVSMAVIFSTMLFWQYLEWRRNFLVVTGQRVVTHRMRLLRSESVMDTPLKTIVNIQLLKPMAGKLLGFGDLSVDTYTGKNLIRAVPLADQVQALIEFQIGSARKESNAREQARFSEILAARQTGDEYLDKQKTIKNPGETKDQRGEIVYRTHWVILLGKIFLPTLVFALVVLSALFLFLNGVFPASSLAFFSLTFVFLGASVIWWLYQFFDWYYDRYQIINDQIIDINQKPLGREERRSASIFNIQSIRFERKGLAGILLNYGTVFIRIGDEEFTFDNVSDPADVQTTIFKALQASISNKNEKELSSQQIRLANWLETYQQFQKDRDKQPE
jgi:hypothetical protein